MPIFSQAVILGPEHGVIFKEPYNSVKFYEKRNNKRGYTVYVIGGNHPMHYDVSHKSLIPDNAFKVTPLIKKLYKL